MRAAISCVLPDPAPASTMRLRSSSVRIRLRAGASRRMSAMIRQPPVRRERRILQLLLRPLVDLRSARATVVAEPAILLLWRVDERAGRDDIAQIRQYGAHGRGRLQRDDLSLETSLGAREVVLRAAQLRLRRARLQQLERSEPIERVLQAASSGKRTLPGRRVVAPRLVIEN